jgi:fructokinase
MSTSSTLIAGIEAGGTKFNLALGTGPDDICATARIPTTTPEETMAAVIAWLESAAAEHGNFDAIGVGSFGPLELDRARAKYGYITSTPKQLWQDTDVVGPLRERFGVPVGFDTDVNAAALGESIWGAGQGVDPLVYLTIGTGVGGGVMVNGQPLHGLLHPEMGHLQVPVSAREGMVNADCQCPFHDGCLEGYVSGPAIAARWGAPAESFYAGAPALVDAADILARGLVTLITVLSPRRIILGGGVMHAPGVMDDVRAGVLRHLNGYLQVPELLEKMNEYIVAPGLGDWAGVLGSIALGKQAIRHRG